MPLERLSNNRAVKMLNAAAAGKYGVLGVVSYNMETIVGAIAAAEAKKAPLQILLFPWALKYSPLLVDFAAHAARKAKVPVAIHMDHAQDPEIIKTASQIKAEDGTPAFDSIMVDMSHYEKEENLAKTKELVAICHSRGIATEAEPGRIEGGEDGVKDTAELEGMMTTPEEVEDFIATGIDFLAPAFGNVHGDYHGVENIHLDYDRQARPLKPLCSEANMIQTGRHSHEGRRPCPDRAARNQRVHPRDPQQVHRKGSDKSKRKQDGTLGLL